VTLQWYRGSHSPEDYCNFRQATKQAKHVFFDRCVSEIAKTNSRPWDLMGWIQQHKLPPCEAIHYHNKPCHTLDDLWGALHRMYNSASGREFNTLALDALPSQPVRDWARFSKAELTNKLSGCSNVSAPGPDHLKWSHLKRVIQVHSCATVILAIADACLVVAIAL